MSPLTLTGAGPTFSPLSISGLQAWYKSDVGTLTDGAAHLTAASTQFLKSASVSLGVAGTMSWSGWVKFDTLTANTYYNFFSYKGYASGGFVIQRAGDVGNNCLRLGFAGTDLWDGPVFSTTATWTHLVVTITGTTCNFWVNGTKTAGTHSTGVASFTTTDPQTITFGRREDNTSQYLNGAVDSVGIWGKVLSDAEVAWLYNSGAGRIYSDLTAGSALAGITTSLQPWYDMDEVSGTRYDANRTTGFDLTTLGGTPTQVQGIASGTAQDENFCGQFTAASSQFLSIASNSTLTMGGTQQFTFTAWVYPDSLPAEGPVIGKWQSSSNLLDYLLFFNGTNFRFQISSTGTGTTATATDGTSISTAKWYFIACGYDGANIWISVNNGVKTTGASALSAFSTAAVFNLGRDQNNTQFWDGRIDSVGLWKSTLSASDLTALFNGGKGLKYAGLAGAGITTPTSYWDMDKVNPGGLTADSAGTNTLTNNNTVTNGQGVNYISGVLGTWQDQSGNARHLTQATPSKRMAFVSNFKNGKPAILGDGVGTYLQSAQITAINQPMTTFVVWRHHNNGGTALDSYSINGGLVRSNANKYNIYAGADLNGDAWVADTWVIHTGIFNGASSSVQVNNNAATTGDAGTGTRDGFTVGTRGDGSTAPMNGYITEVLVYTGVLNANQITQILNYLNGRYAIY